LQDELIHVLILGPLADLPVDYPDDPAAGEEDEEDEANELLLQVLSCMGAAR